MGRKDNFTAYLILAPFLIVFIVFLLLPVFYSLYLSFFKVGPYTDLTSVFASMEFAGFSNYVTLINDREFLWSLLVTFLYGLMTVPGTILLSLVLALILNREMKGRAFFRSAFFLPNVLDMLVIGFAWQLIYAPKYGILTRVLEYFFNIYAFHDTGFLGNEYYALPAIAFAMILKGSGFGLILFLASLGNIPKSLYEAAEIDGANRWEILVNITLPLLKPTILFLVVTGTMAALNGFTEIYAMTDAKGGPSFVDPTGLFGHETLGATKISGFYLWKVFSFGRYGYAAAMSYILLMVALCISYLNARWLKSRDTH